MSRKVVEAKDLGSSKSAHRKSFRKAEASFRQSAYFSEAQKSLSKNVTQALAHKSGFWGAYLSLPGEPDLVPGLRQLTQVNWVFPKLSSDTEMQFVEWDFKSPLTTNALGGHEPANDQIVDKRQIEGLLIPGLAFDPWGTRLGRGRGYYDRYLSDYQGEKWGVAFSPQISQDRLPRHEFDQPVTYIVTETEILQARDGDC